MVGLYNNRQNNGILADEMVSCMILLDRVLADIIEGSRQNDLFIVCLVEANKKCGPYLVSAPLPLRLVGRIC